MRIDRRDLLRNLQRSRGRDSLARILLDTRVQDLTLDGLTLDLGSGRDVAPTYHGHFRRMDRTLTIAVDIVPSRRPHVLADLELGLPFRDSAVGCVIMFNLLEHIYHGPRLCAEVFRVLQPGGKCYALVPFLYRIHDEPGDYFRHTEFALHRMLSDAGFPRVEVESLGFGPFTTAWSFLDQVLPVRPLHGPVSRLTFKLDAWLSGRSGNFNLRRLYPLACFATAIKDRTS